MFLFLSAAALAGELHVQVDSPVAVYVDGQQIPADGQRIAHAKGLAEGMHGLLIKDLTDRVVVDTSVKVGESEWVMVGLKGGEVWPLGRDHLAAQHDVLAAAIPGASVSITVNIDDGLLPPGQPPPPPEVVIEADKPMDGKAFAGLVSAVDDESFSDDQLDLVRGAAGSNHFTCAQVVALMETFSFASDQVEVVQILRPRIVDPENSHLLNGPLTFSSDKEAVQALFR
jgi:hypothetical protein